MGQILFCTKDKPWIVLTLILNRTVLPSCYLEKEKRKENKEKKRKVITTLLSDFTNALEEKKLSNSPLACQILIPSVISTLCHFWFYSQLQALHILSVLLNLKLHTDQCAVTQSSYEIEQTFWGLESLTCSLPCVSFSLQRETICSTCEKDKCQRSSTTSVREDGGQLHLIFKSSYKENSFEGKGYFCM